LWERDVTCTEFEGFVLETMTGSHGCLTTYLIYHYV